MSDQLSVTISFVKDHYEVTASLVTTDVLPEAIFLYRNTGTTQLGEYYGVAFLSEIQARQVWTGVAIPSFGNAFVRYTQAFVIAPNLEEATKAAELIKESTKTLKSQILSAESITEVITL